MSLIDIIGIVVVLFYMIGGYGRGFIRSFASTVQYILGYIIARVLSPVMAEVIYSGYMEESIRGKVFTAVDVSIQRTAGESLEVVRAGVIDSVENGVIFGKTIAEKMTANWNMYTILKEGGETMGASVTDGIMGQIEPLLTYILGIMLFIIIFLIARIVLGLVLGVLTTILDTINITRFMDSVLGLVIGGLKGIIASIVIISIMYIMVSMTGELGSYITEETFNASKLFSVARDFANI